MNTSLQGTAGSGRRFAAVIVLVYLLPVLLFVFLTLVMPGATGIIPTLLTAGISALWFIIGMLALRADGRSLRSVGFDLRHTAWALGFILVGWAVSGIVLLALRQVTLGSFFQTDARNLLLQWVFVGIGEEVLFRGYVLNWLEQRFKRLGPGENMLAAALVSSVLFACWHLPQRLYQVAIQQSRLVEVLPSLLIVFVLGLVFAYFYKRSGNLLLVGLVHGSMNAPLIAQHDNLLPVAVFIVLLEVGILVWKGRKKAAVSIG